MNYFELYPGDYLKDTGRLTLVDHGAYLRLLLEYYATEQPLPADYDELYTIAAAVKPADRAAVKKVADRYFPIGIDGLRHNKKADEEIEKAQARITAARENGKRGGRPKKNPAGYEEKPNGFDVGSNPVFEKETQKKALHTPHATRQSPSDTSPQSDSTKASDTHRARVSPPSPTAAGEACRAMRGAGLAQTNPSHPGLLALIDAGATSAQFAMAAGDAVARGKGFAYALGILKGQLADAASPIKPGKGDPESIHNRNRAVAAEWLAEQSAGGTS